MQSSLNSGGVSADPPIFFAPSRGPKEGKKSLVKKPENHGKPWTMAERRRLKQLAEQNAPTRVIGLELRRTAAAVSSEASDLGISLRPANRPRYSRRG